MSGLLRRLLLAGAGVMVGMQFVGPARTNPPFDPANHLAHRVVIPADVATLLDRSCRNCHSYETAWPWYAYVAPVSWAVIGHVNEGRAHMNFSAWPESPEEGVALLDEVCGELEAGRMPLPSYTWIHRSAILSDAERTRLCRWANDTADQLLAY